MSPLHPPDAEFLSRLEQALGPGALVPPEPRYLEEPRGRFEGRAAAIARPADTAGVAATVRLCAAEGVGIVPYAGGTGLVGGQVLPTGPDPIVLSVERLSGIRDLDRIDNVIEVGAGTVLAEVQDAARDAGRLFPLSLASEGSAQIGGLLATNAGGVAVLRYGNARSLCLGVEAVLADGSILKGLGRLMKDNSGYDMSQLLIGSEGTLGIITAASLRLFSAPGETATAWLAVGSPAEALTLLDRLREDLGGSIVAFELIHVQGLAFLAEMLPDIPRPPEMSGPWRVLVEVADAAGAGPSGRLEAALASTLETGLVADGVLAQSEAQRTIFWRTRESIPEANRLIGAITSHDISLPPSRLPDFVSEGGARLAALDPEIRINCFGHLGDGNLHFNTFPPVGGLRQTFEARRAEITRTVHDLVVSMGGSVSAEHGIGRLKAGDLARYGDPAKLAAMRAIKQALDPKGILNPGVLFC